MKPILYLIFSSLFLLTHCSKEAFINKEQYLHDKLNGYFRISSFTINNTEVSPLMGNQIAYKYYIYYNTPFEISSHTSNYATTDNPGWFRIITSINCNETYYFSITDDLKNMHIYFQIHSNSRIGNIPGTLPIHLNNSISGNQTIDNYLYETWRIIKLNHNELQLETKFEGNIHRITLTKI